MSFFDKKFSLLSFFSEFFISLFEDSSSPKFLSKAEISSSFKELFSKSPASLELSLSELSA